MAERGPIPPKADALFLPRLCLKDNNLDFDETGLILIGWILLPQQKSLSHFSFLLQGGLFKFLN